MRARDQARRRRDLARDLRERHHPDPDSVPALSPPQWREQPGMLLVARENLLARPQVEARDHGIDTVGGRSGQCHLLRRAPEHARVAGAEPHGHFHRLIEIRVPAPTVRCLVVDPLVHGLGRATRDRTLGAGVQIGQPFHYRELRAEGGRIGGCHSLVCSANSSLACSTSSRLITLPVALRGSSSTKTTSRGTL